MGSCIASSPLAPPAIRHHCRRRGSGGETRQLRGGPVATDRPRAGPGPAGVGPSGDRCHARAASPTTSPRPRLGPDGPCAGARLPRPRDQDGQDGRLRRPLTSDGAGPRHGRGGGPPSGGRPPATSRPRPNGTTTRGAAPGHDPRRQTMRAFHSPGTTIRAAVLAASLATTGAASALAEEPDQGAAVVTPLGAGSSALTYWTDVPEGFRVVTTVDTVQPGATARHAVVRSSIVLRPGQAQTISLPGPPGSASPGLEVRRLGDRVEVRAAGPAALAD